MTCNLPEILAPAGNMESLKAAVINGADAVYLGLKDFSARAKAANFSTEELREAVAYAHLFGVKVYVAINIVIKESEMNRAVDAVENAVATGIDALIIQDIGLLYKIRDIAENVPLHASTQMGIHNVYGANMAKKLGFDRIILSRETTLEDVKHIRNNVDIELEMFIQGALCVAFSGNCLFSSLVSGYSGNRGKCLQLCRKKYRIEIEDKVNEGYYLSAKDICMLSELKSLINVGIDSFKIEGRMRRAEYVGESVNVYRQALEAIYNGKTVNAEKETDRLKRLFNRGDYCAGYLRNPTENVVFPKIQGHKGIKIGHVCKVTGNSAQLQINADLRKNDGLKFINEKEGETGGALVSDISKITFQGNVKSGDEVYLTTDSKQINEINTRKRQYELSPKVILKTNKQPKIISESEGVGTVTLLDCKVQRAKSAPISRENIYEIFSRSVLPWLNIKSVECDIDDNIFLTIGQLKELRRLSEQNICNALTEKFYNMPNRKNYNSHTLSDIIHQKFDFTFKTIAIIDSLPLIEILNENNYIDAFAFSPKDYSDYSAIEETFRKSKKPMFLDTPIMARDKDLNILEELSRAKYINNIIANNLYALDLFSDKNILLGPGLNLINDSTVGLKRIISQESDSAMQQDYITAFSQLPIMTFAHCPKKNIYRKCPPNCKGFLGKLTDELGNNFNITHYKIYHCYAQLKNERYFCITEELRKKNHKNCVYDFRDCAPEFVNKFIRNLSAGKNYDFTHTHFNFNKVLR